MLGAAGVAGYAVALRLALALGGPGVLALTVIPVSAVGWRLGLRAGLAAGLAAIPLHTLLLSGAGHGGWDALARVGGLPGSLAIVALGAVGGHLRNLERRAADLPRALRSEQEHLRAAAAEREQYVRMLTQELDNPHSAIAFAANALLRLKDPDVPALAAGIAEEIEGARRLVRGLVDVAQAERPQPRLQRAPVPLGDIARRTIGGFDAGQHTIELRCETPEPVVAADADALAKALRHLLSNAVLYTRPGPVRCAVRTAPGARAGLVEVLDQGPAIPPDERDALFRQFVRLSTAAGTSGAGLSLYVTRLIVDAHGGSLGADWPAAGGNRFWFTVPLAATGAPD